MLLKREFYFVRHGQTDHNLKEGKEKGDHQGDIPLNSTGELQATAIEPIIASLPIETICFSPMKRAQQTKEIITPRLRAPHFEIEDLGECTAEIWREMAEAGMDPRLPFPSKTRLFIDRVRNGMNQALSLPGPALIVAHGGVHWAICSLMGIEGHEWRIDNCGIVHFTIATNGKWSGKKIRPFLS